jgi:hypothetical protein
VAGIDEHEAVAAMPPADRDLLERHLPLLRYDAQSAYRSLSAAAITDWPENALRRADGSTVATGEGVLTLELLCAYPGGEPVEPGDVLDEGPDHLAAAAHFQADPRYSDRIYGRVVRGAARTWLQYWLFYYYNPHNLLGFARHEGDWELVQVGLGADGEPEVATYAQHRGGAALAWDEVEHHPDPSGPRPVVYVAPFSNACYPRPGRFLYLGGIDHPAGDGPTVSPLIEPFAEWAAWPGRWGASGGVLAGRFGGLSPRSPAHQADRWSDPEAFHRRLARPSLRRALRRILAWASDSPPPPAPQLEARLEGAVALVAYRLPGGWLGRGRHLYLTVHDADAPDQVLGRLGFTPVRRAGAVEIELARAPIRGLVRATAFGMRRQRSRPVEAETD